MHFMRAGLVVTTGLLLVATTMQGQVMTRFATTVDAVLRYPAFFHDKSVSLIATPVPVADGAQIGVAVESPRTFVIAPGSGQPPNRVQEFRGRLYDIGRFVSDDSRLGPLNLPAIITSVMGDRWPARERLYVLTGSTWSDAPDRADGSLRSISLVPAAFVGQTVTVRGRFRGRNLFGDLPAWPRQSEWDFVLQSADAALWVLGRRPRGSGFDLSTTNRAHTGRWLEVTGRVEVRDDLPVLIATGMRLTEAEADPEDVAAPAAAVLPAPEVIFSAPTPGEIQVAPDVVVRLQFSRPMRVTSFDDQVRVRYRGLPEMPTPAVTVTYRPGPMAVEIRFEGPLAPGREVEVVLGSGVEAADGVALEGYTLRFTISG